MSHVERQEKVANHILKQMVVPSTYMALKMESNKQQTLYLPPVVNDVRATPLPITPKRDRSYSLIPILERTHKQTTRTECEEKGILAFLGCPSAKTALAQHAT